jgi:hypothetical protein
MRQQGLSDAFLILNQMYPRHTAPTHSFLCSCPVASPPLYPKAYRQHLQDPPFQNLCMKQRVPCLRLKRRLMV